MTDQITRNAAAADLFAHLSEQGKGEAVYESDFFNLVLAQVVSAYTGTDEDKANLGRAVLACVDDYLEPEIDAAVADRQPVDYEHDAAHASRIIDRDNAQAIRLANVGCFDPLV